jgi:septum formation protein
LKNGKIILASASPRRSFLLKEIGIQHEVKKFDFIENIPEDVNPKDASLFLAKSKSEQILNKNPNHIYITADTVVILDNYVLGKPSDALEAEKTLSALSSKCHSVITGVCITNHLKTVSFKVESKVFFKSLTEEEILFYIDHYKPFDKAGSYGIQEWIGMIGIEKIEGSYFNIMGLPTFEVYSALKNF